MGEHGWNERKKRAQTSGEFFIAFIALLLLYTGLIILYSNWVQQLNLTKSKLEANQAGDRVAFTANFVYLAGDGVTYSVFLNAPTSNITITRNIVDVNSTRAPAVSQVEMLTNYTNYTVIRNQGNLSVRNNGGRIDFR